jgi:hypothetical protein
MPNPLVSALQNQDCQEPFLQPHELQDLLYILLPFIRNLSCREIPGYREEDDRSLPPRVLPTLRGALRRNRWHSPAWKLCARAGVSALLQGPGPSYARPQQTGLFALFEA